MCFMDWRIGRLITLKRSLIPSSSGGVLNIMPNQQRVGVTISPSVMLDATGTYEIPVTVFAQIFDSLSNIDSEAIIIRDNPWTATLATHGSLPTRGFRCQSELIANVDPVFIEYLAPEWLLAVGLEELKRASPSWPKGY